MRTISAAIREQAAPLKKCVHPGIFRAFRLSGEVGRSATRKAMLPIGAAPQSQIKEEKEAL
jgi:hypothetical protein